jgi:hypothetical protein
MNAEYFSSLLVQVNEGPYEGNTPVEGHQVDLDRAR